MAEGLLFKYLGTKDQIDSCGTSNYHQGELADLRMRNTAKTYGIDLTHQSRQITMDDFEIFDLLLVMDSQNLKDVLALTEKHKNKVKLISDLSTNYKGQMIPDPYFGDQKGFDDVYKLLDHICKEIAQNIDVQYRQR